MAAEGLFTESVRESRWLSDHLNQRHEPRLLLSRIRAAQTVEELDLVQSMLSETLAAMTPDYPALSPLRAAKVAEEDGEFRTVSASQQISTTRFWFSLPITGEFQLLRYWPDEGERPLQSVHHELMERIGGYANLAQAPVIDAKEYWRLEPTWQLHPITDEDGQWALYTFVDLTHDEEISLFEEGGFQALLANRCDRVTAIVEEIATQTAKYFEVVLPELTHNVIDTRRRTVTRRALLLKDLTVPEEWGPEPLELEAIPGTVPAAAASEVQADVLAPGPAETGDSRETALDLRGVQYRLSPKSFAEVLRTMRTWADAVEQNPRAFAQLDEDALSDLLAATLNATVPHADREVFSRSGKTDIHIRADVLAEGTGPAEVFICETKVARSQAAIRGALEEQIFRYLTARSTQAVLLALCRQTDFATAEDRVRSWAAEARGYTGRNDGDVRGWPHFTYDLEGRTVEVCVATVAVPRVTTRAGTPK